MKQTKTNRKIIKHEKLSPTRQGVPSEIVILSQVTLSGVISPLAMVLG